jgi:hypothetical protein
MEATSALEARARHWIVDAAVGAAVALSAITMAHAALPDRTAPAPAVRGEAAPRHVPTFAPSLPPVLISFESPAPAGEIVSPFGLRQLPWEENGRLHEGVDIAADFGAPVVAAADGVVTRAGHSDSYGRFVEIEHAEGLTTLYAHMGGVADGLRPGLPVKVGHTVGRVGSSGTSTGPHLHFEIRDSRDRPLNPTHFLGKSFARAEDLPLREARRFPRRVRLAYVSRIPESKKALMEARLEAKSARAAAATGAAKDAVMISYGDGRPKATIRVGAERPPLAATGVEADAAAAVRPPPPLPAAPSEAADEAIATAKG